MSRRTSWATATTINVEVVDEYRDQHGTGLDEGNLGLVLSTDEDLVIEGSLRELRDVAAQITDACDEFENQIAWPEEDR